MKRIITLVYLLFQIQLLLAQVPKKVIVEHFTNTLCSICANRNPSFRANLSNFPQVVSLAIHPSSPYSSCIFNQHNPNENDERTNFYGIFGGTPRLVIQGAVIPPSANYGDASLFQSQLGQTSPFRLSVRVGDVINGAIEVRVTVKAEASHNYTTLRLFAAVAEDTIFYNAPNGETIHTNVFRKSVFATAGITIAPPTTVGDSITQTTTISISNDWDITRIFALATLQEVSSKAVVQAETSKAETTTSTLSLARKKFNLYAAQGQLFFTPNETGEYTLQLIDLQGRILNTFQVNTTKSWDFSHLPTGIYAIRVLHQGQSASTLVRF